MIAGKFRALFRFPSGVSNRCRRPFSWSVGMAFSFAVFPLGAVLPLWAQTFSSTGSLGSARTSHSANLLGNGKVLVAGGRADSGSKITQVNSAELYDPGAGTFAATGSMGVARGSHRSVVLTNGKVLVTGGFNTGATVWLDTVEVYDPVAGSFSSTGSMAAVRSSHAAILLPNGKVLVLGGLNGPSSPIATAEIYDPGTGMFSATGSMAVARGFTTATLLGNGKVLVAGGFDGSLVQESAELYDPASGTFAPTGSMTSARSSHTATLLANGKVLVAGGNDSGGVPSDTAELFDPVSGTFSPTGSMATGRLNASATLLPNGRVLIAGGVSGTVPTTITDTAELYHPVSGTFAATGAMATERSVFSTTLLPNAKVLVAGGATGTGSTLTSNAQLYSSIVNCSAADSLQTAIDLAQPGFTLSVAGTCNENVLIRNEKQRIALDGGGTATISAPSPSNAAVNIRGKGILLQNFTITGGSNGVWINRGSNASLINNIIQNSNGNGVVVDELAFSVLTNNTIQGHPGGGVIISENSTARIGFNADGEMVASANTIQSNGADGIVISNGSSARIVGNTVSNNSGEGIVVVRDSHADIASNVISLNANGIEVGENSFVHLGEETGSSIYESPNTGTNAGFGIKCTDGGSADGRQGAMTGSGGSISFTGSCINDLSP